jgi:hypothetical protein
MVPPGSTLADGDQAVFWIPLGCMGNFQGENRRVREPGIVKFVPGLHGLAGNTTLSIKLVRRAGRSMRGRKKRTIAVPARRSFVFFESKK